MRLVFLGLALLAGMFLCSGCSNKNPQGRCALEGTVTLDDVPITKGVISFEPCGTQALRIRSGTEVLDGAFSLIAAEGLVEGEYIVRVTAQEEVPGKMVNTMAGPMPEMRSIVPKKYGSASKEKITIKKGEKNIVTIKMESDDK